ncbi:MAG: beta-galactosidase trimerization domain-containing protein [Edaphobacter sp.]
MDPASASAIRGYVRGGGTVLMTAFSAKTDEHGQWFNTPLPGLLSDVFGLKTNAFYDAASPLKFDLDGDDIDTGVHRYEVLEPSTATVLTRFTAAANSVPAVTVNRFGKGRAIYLATESKASVMGPVLAYVYKLAGVQLGQQTPQGVFARVVEGRTLYVNTTQQEKRIPITGTRKGLISHRAYDGAVVLGPWEADLIQ